MPDIIVLSDERMDAKCASVKELILAFENHQGEMSRTQIIRVCNDIIKQMIEMLEILELFDEN
jgi:hypothetical protein